jgi:hypothetical protein
MKTVKHFASNIILALRVAPLSFGQHYDQTTLVTNTSGIASATDPQLVNAWGLSRISGSDWWISDAGTGVSTLYDGAGDKQSLVVTIPPAEAACYRGVGTTLEPHFTTRAPAIERPLTLHHASGATRVAIPGSDPFRIPTSCSSV